MTCCPAAFHDQMIHTDAGPNVVRAYPTKKSGAGYTAEILNILKGEKDQWFRPADVCVAPDGSLIIADWYDPGVGGHQAGDQTRGRIYRVAPTGSDAYTIPKQDYSTVAGAVAALQNPNLATRYKAFTALQTMGKQAIPVLQSLWQNKDANPKMRARALWVLVKMKNADASKYIMEALRQTNPDLRIVGLRAARELNLGVIDAVKQLVNDPDIQVRREAAIALYHNKSPEAPQLWATLASQHDGKDRWYLEALGIGADKQWNSFFDAYKTKVKDPTQSAASRDIVFRARTDEAVPYLAQLASQKETPVNDRLRYFRAFDFNTGPLKSKLLLNMLEFNRSNDTTLNRLVLHALDTKTVKGSALAQKALQDLLRSVPASPEYLELVRRYELKTENKTLLDLAINKYQELMGREAADLLLKSGGSQMAWDVITGGDTSRTNALLTSLSRVGSKESIDMLQTLVQSAKYPMAVRKQAAQKIGKSGGAEDRVLVLLKSKKIPAELMPDVVASLQGAWRRSVRVEAQSYLPNAKTEGAKKIPTMADLASLKGDAAAGKGIFTNTCAVCHMVNNEGFDFGPKLSEIGSKYPKEGLLEQIVYPSKGISFGYEGSELKMKDGSTLTGIVASKTETDLILKMPGGIKQNLKTSNVASSKELKTSMMPEGLYDMPVQDLANLLAYLEGLKKK